MTEIIVAVVASVIPAVASIVGVVVSNSKTKSVMQIKIEALTEEVKKHNNFAQRVPLLEERDKVINHRLEDLEDAEREIRKKIGQ